MRPLRYWMGDSRKENRKGKSRKEKGERRKEKKVKATIYLGITLGRGGTERA